MEASSSKPGCKRWRPKLRAKSKWREHGNELGDLPRKVALQRERMPLLPMFHENCIRVDIGSERGVWAFGKRELDDLMTGKALMTLNAVE